MRSVRKYICGIVDELMNNAIKAKATTIDVNVEQIDDEVIIYVKDNGQGMTSEKLEEVKRKLQQPRRRELEEYYGALVGESMAGTGLSLVGMITDRAEVSSEPGKGTEITAYIRLND